MELQRQAFANGPAGRTAVEGTCAGMRAGVHDEVSRARGCDHVSLSKWHRHRWSRKARKSPPPREPPASRRRHPGSRSPARFHDVRKRNDLGRTRSFISREIATRGSGTVTGVSEVARRARWSTGRKRPISRDLEPPKRARCRENTVRTGFPQRSRRRKTSRLKREARSPHDTMGARF